jgi:hypothetical protein
MDAPGPRSAGPSRRAFLRRALAGAGLAALPGAARGAAAQDAADARTAGLPFRQDDPRWGRDRMWDRALVIRADVQLNGRPRAEAEALLREFEDGNTIANEGCLLTCLAMALRLLAPAADPPWTPATLNAAAQEAYFFTPCGLSMTALYADLASEVSGGRVQLCAKEEYLPGEPSWPRIDARGAPLVRAYRALPPARRRDVALVLKTGTYDDTVASHYVLLDPGAAEPDGADALVLDPARPPGEDGPWRLTDSARQVTRDPEIAAAWKEARIEPTQLGGAWAFARWSEGRPQAAALVRAWADELARR